MAPVVANVARAFALVNVAPVVANVARAFALVNVVPVVANVARAFALVNEPPNKIRMIILVRQSQCIFNAIIFINF